ncbi:hypothetical protein ACB092_09G020400 [Castanea dentata]
MEIQAISVAAKIAEYTGKPVGQWLCYSFQYGTNIENMKNRVMELKAARDRVQHRVTEAVNNVEEIETDVNMWLTKVDDILGRAREVLDHEEKAKTSSSKMACLSLKLRHKHSKKANKILQEIDELITKNCRFDKVSYRPASKGSVTTTNMDYITFKSRNANINMIGVWGMAVAMKVKEKKLFDEVAIATVTHKPDLLRIQGEIADKLDLKLDKETLSGRADLLRERLTKEKNTKILVILDDIWENLDLSEIGIPYEGCKIVMGAQMDFGLELSGDSLKESNLRSKAMEVSIACAGLPLALVTTAKALKNKRLFEWEDALRQLRRPSPQNQKRMQEVTYSAIKLSYSHLESPELQSFFLFYLLKKCFGLRLFHGISTLEEARNRIYTLVRSLKDSGLLLDAHDTSECVGMHDLTRDVALLIANETQNVLTIMDEGLVEWPDEDDMKMCTKIFVFNRDIHELPDRLECPELRCLHVYAEDREGSFKISDTFFRGTRKLKVLDLTYMRISSLPSSLKLLTNLQTLSIIGEMKNLEILKIGLLTHLRMLDLSNCKKLEVIPANLYVGNSFTQWEVEGLNNERASLAELKHLSRLSTLEVHIPDANMMPKDLLFEKLTRYKIFIGDVWDWSDKHENSRVLKLKLNTCNQLEKDLYLDKLNGFQQLKHLHVQNNAEIKYIIHSRDLIFSLKNMIKLEGICDARIPLTSFRDIRIMKVEHSKGLSQLQELEIKECNIMRAIVVKEDGELEDRDMILFPQLCHLKLQVVPKLKSFLSTQNSFITDVEKVIHEGELDFHVPILHEQVVFPKLETLELSSLDSEEILLQNQHRASSSFKLTNIQTDSRFQNLCKLKLKGSGNLKYLLSSSTARNMVQLKYLDIEECKVMEEILFTEDLGEEEIISKVLFPRLEGLILKDLPVLKRFCVGSNIRFPSLKDMWLERCPKLKSFIFKPVSSGLTLSKELKEMNSGEISHTAMQPLFNEEVAFPSLETLTIFHMEKLKIIWHNQLAEYSFLKLQSLLVQYCENLVNIFQSNMLTKFQSLKRLYVYDCGSLQEVFELQRHNVRESHVVMAIPLKRLMLQCLPKMKHVWNKEPQGIFSFQNLQKISVWECESLKSLFPASVARCLVQLEDLLIVNCGVEEIVSREDVAEPAARFVFPKVTVLVLSQLPKLKWFCRGVHTSKWPLLKELMGTLFPNLEALTLDRNYNLEEIQSDQLLEECFHKLKILHVAAYLPGSNWITFLKRLNSLEKLFVKISRCVEIFPYEELFDQENHATILTQLRELELFHLPMLTHLWKEDTQPSPVLYNLENLKVSLCGKLKILVPSSVFFQNLTNLEILKCHGLINLVTSSTAKSLLQLKKMSVSECKRITEVVVGEGGEANEVITFTHLTYLKLDDLTNLASFCSGSYSFKFPSLEEVIVRQCPEIKTFSHGSLRTPKLERVQATQEDEWHWKADLNTTIHWLWENNL